MFRSEFRACIRLATPTILSNTLSFMMPLADSAFIGHLGVSEFAAASISNALYNMIWLFLVGCCTAVTTFVSQAHGMNDQRAIKYWFWHGMLVMTIICVPAMLLQFFGGFIVEYIFLQSKEISKLSTIYCQILTPGLWFHTTFLVIQNTMQAQNVMMPSVYCSLLANIVNFVANYLLIYESGLGFTGAPVATTLSRFILLVTLSCFSYFGNRQILHKTEGSSLQNEQCSKHIGQIEMKGVQRFLSIAFPGGIMQCMEGWFFNITIVLAGQLGEIVLSAHQVLMNVIAFTYLSVPFAISITASIRVGNLLGGNLPLNAISASKVCTLLGTGFMAISGVILVSARNQIALIFTTNADVILICRKLFYVGALFQVVDGFQTCVAGALRGMGKQKLIAKWNFFAYWIIGVPAGATLSFLAGYGVYGLWWGITIGLSTVSVAFARIISKVDWKEEAEKAQNTSRIAKKGSAPKERYDDEEKGDSVGGDEDRAPSLTVRVKDNAQK